jgi:hypothetical protein
MISLAIGLTVGVAGAILFLQSMPPKEGSAEERVGKLEVELKRANNRVIALEGQDPQGRRGPGRVLADGARSIAEAIRDGKPVTPDDVFRATQPLIRDLAPLFDRVRVREQQRKIDGMVGELARKYSLNPTQQESLKKWFEQKAVDESKRFTDLVSRDGTKLEDLVKASADFRLENGLDQYMQRVLTGDKLAAFKMDQMTERVARVQQEADMKVERLDAIVGLDDAQRGQVFSTLARGARDFDPSMQFEGLGTDAVALTSQQSKQDAILAVLRPDQRMAYEEDREKRRVEQEKDLGAIGLSLPKNWDSLDPSNF